MYSNEPFNQNIGNRNANISNDDFNNNITEPNIISYKYYSPMVNIQSKKSISNRINNNDIINNINNNINYNITYGIYDDYDFFLIMNKNIFRKDKIN